MESATKLFEQRNAEKLKAREKLRAGKKKKYSPGPQKIPTTEPTNHASVLQPPASGGSSVPGGSSAPSGSSIPNSQVPWSKFSIFLSYFYQFVLPNESSFFRSK